MTELEELRRRVGWQVTAAYADPLSLRDLEGAVGEDDERRWTVVHLCPFADAEGRLPERFRELVESVFGSAELEPVAGLDAG